MKCFVSYCAMMSFSMSFVCPTYYRGIYIRGEKYPWTQGEMLHTYNLHARAGYSPYTWAW